MYNYFKDEGVMHPLFIFTTDNADIYKVEFVPHDYGSVITKKLYTLSFFPVTRSFLKYDSKISPTIVNIISQFLSQDPENVLWYMCSPEDYNPRSRHIVFNKWYKQFSETNTDYSRYDDAITNYDNTETFYISFIFNKNVFEERYIEQEIYLTLTSIEEQKNQ